MSEISIFRGVDFTGTDWGRRNIDIAAELGVDAGLVSAARRYFGMVLSPRANWDEVDWEKSNAEIAAEKGVSYSAAARMRAELGMTRHGRVDWSGVDWAKTNAEICAELGVAPSSVTKARMKYTGKRAPVNGGRPRLAEAAKPQNISVQFPPADFAALEAAAEARGVTKAALIREALREFLKK